MFGRLGRSTGRVLLSNKMTHPDYPVIYFSISEYVTSSFVFSWIPTGHPRENPRHIIVSHEGL